MAVILKGVVPANFKVAEVFCRNRFESAVDMGFERGHVVDCATSWSMSDEEQMEKVEQHIRDEKTVLFLGSPMCWAFSTLIELTQAGEPSEMWEDCSCLSIRGMGGLVASVSSMKWRREIQDEWRLVSIIEKVSWSMSNS